MKIIVKIQKCSFSKLKTPSLYQSKAQPMAKQTQALPLPLLLLIPFVRCQVNAWCRPINFAGMPDLT